MSRFSNLDYRPLTLDFSLHLAIIDCTGWDEGK